MSRVRIRRGDKSPPELEITAFMNLMVVLVPFLLITAVFSQMSILELNLPPANQPRPDQDQPQKEVNFELIIRKNSITVADTLGGPIKSFEATGGSFDMKGINDLLLRIKEKFPDKLNITLLLEQNVNYDILVQVMDAVRVVTQIEEGVPVKRELFPQIAIGDAPPPEPVVEEKGK
ncbi:MAG: biopolymer transporter ExbD [Gammaproteobacteria bacterium]|nr:biopolymer transporter ExbD [Gammaproteobacteria bacterium]